MGGDVDVTRPGGTTPRGLPYPGSSGAHANTPAALQALAEAITAQMGTLPGGIVLDTFVGKLTSGIRLQYQSASIIVPFAKLGTVLGAVVSYGNFLDGNQPAVVPGWVQNDWLNTARFYIVPANNNVPPYNTPADGKSYSICAIGWGYAA